MIINYTRHKTLLGENAQFGVVQRGKCLEERCPPENQKVPQTILMTPTSSCSLPNGSIKFSGNAPSLVIKAASYLSLGEEALVSGLQIQEPFKVV